MANIEQAWFGIVETPFGLKLYFWIEVKIGRPILVMVKLGTDAFITISMDRINENAIFETVRRDWTEGKGKDGNIPSKALVSAPAQCGKPPCQSKIYAPLEIFEKFESWYQDLTCRVFEAHLNWPTMPFWLTEGMFRLNYLWDEVKHMIDWPGARNFSTLYQFKLQQIITITFIQSRSFA